MISCGFIGTRTGSVFEYKSFKALSYAIFDELSIQYTRREEIPFEVMAQFLYASCETYQKLHPKTF